jgi:hypothetical protein
MARNNAYLNSIRSLDNIIKDSTDEKISTFTAPAFSNIEISSNRIYPFEDVVENNITVHNLKTKKNGVLTTIGEMKTKLSDSNKANKEFMDILSKNLQYYNTVVVNIIGKIEQIFDLIKSLDTTKGNPSIGQPEPRREPRTEPPNRRGQPGQNDELIKELVDTINKYLNEFNILKSNIDTVVGNNHILREELSKKSNDLFGNIKKLDDLFLTRFEELGIFNIGGNLFTYNQLQKKFAAPRVDLIPNYVEFRGYFYDANGNAKTYNNRYNAIEDFIKKHFNNQTNITQIAKIIKDNLTGGSKRIKNRKTKRRKPKRKSVKRKKTKYFQTIL